MDQTGIHNHASRAGVLLLALVMAPASAHMHGLAQLDIAIEGHHIELSLHGAGDGFVGFEHAPATPEEQAVVEQAKARLSTLDALLRIGQDCRSDEVDVAPPEPVHEGHHGHDKHDEHDEHDEHHAHAPADWRIQARYVCGQPGSGLRLDAAGLFQAFTRLHEIQVQAIGPEQQSGARLTPQASVFTLP